MPPAMIRLVAALHRVARGAPGLVLGLAIAFALGLVCQAAAAQVTEIRQALRLDATPAGSGPPAAAGTPVSLPDDWARTRGGRGGAAWYRIGFELPAAQGHAQARALRVAHACSGLELWLNGELLHRDADDGSALSGSCARPLLVPLPQALLRTGANRMDLRLSGPALEQVGSRHRAAGLSPLQVGPLDELQAEHRMQLLLQLELRQALGAALLLTGGYMFVLGFLHRRESHLAYFGVVSVTWALLDAPLWLHALPVSRGTFEMLLATLLPLLAQAAVQFLLRYGRQRLAWADRLLPLQCLLVPVSLAAAGPQHLHTGVRLWTVVLGLQVLAAALLYLRRQWRERARSFWVVGSLLALLAAAAAVEAAMQAWVVPALPALLARLAVPLALVLMGLRLVQQHGQALQAAEASNAKLEQRVREAAAEIERNFRQLSELKIEQVTERERKRIAADLHDDLGAKLLTIVHTSESDRISTLAREALEEMRLSVRGLTGKAVRLADALGDWRAEVVSRLAQAGIEAEWSAPEELLQTLSARAYVQTTRILREATSNVIKHSGASYCSVRCQVADGDFQLVVQDNGEGIVSEPDGRLDRGHGMATMKQRAKQMQGQCLVESGPGFGTVIRLTLPLDRALEGA